MRNSILHALQGGQYLKTSDVLRILGISRSSLEWYITHGICDPIRHESRDLLWPPNQVQRLVEAQMLLEDGCSRKDIKELMEKGGGAVQAKMHELSTERNRKSRRETKVTTLRERTAELQRIVGEREGLYLRYLPERWIALAPTMAGIDGLPWRDAFLTAYLNVRDVAETVGWCASTDGGCLISCADGLDESPRTWAYNLLASPPMPACMGALAIDGGCYRVIDPERGTPDCNRDCLYCSRYGRKPDGHLKKSWQQEGARRPELWDDCLMADELEEPYLSGPWASYTQHRLDPDAAPGPASADAREPGPRFRHEPPGGREPEEPRSARIQRMPMEVPLPMGVSAALLPAGVYLCKQCVNDSPEKVVRFMSTLTAIMPPEPLTKEVEERLQRAYTSPEGPRRERFNEGPFIEPFARARIKGDPAMLRCVQDIQTNELGQIKVLTDAALRPEDSYCIICAMLPRSEGEEARYELQLMVDATDFLESKGALPAKGLQGDPPPGHLG